MLITSILKPSAKYVRVYTHRCRLMAIIKKLIFVPFFFKKKGLQEKKNIYLIIDLSIDEWNVAFFCVYIFIFIFWEKKKRICCIQLYATAIAFFFFFWMNVNNRASATLVSSYFMLCYAQHFMASTVLYTQNYKRRVTYYAGIRLPNFTFISYPIFFFIWKGCRKKEIYIRLYY